MPGLDRDRRGFAAAAVGDFQIVAPDQAVVSLGVAQPFEAVCGLYHAALRVECR